MNSADNHVDDTSICDLPAEILSQIMTAVNPATVFAFKYASKYHREVVIANTSARTLLIEAIKAGDTEAVIWLHQMGLHPKLFRTDRGEFCALAARSGNVRLLECLADIGYRANKHIVIHAALGSDDDRMLKYINSKFGYSPSNDSITITAAKGNLPAMRWILGLPGIKFHISQKIAVAAAAGQTEMLKLLFSTGMPYNTVPQRIAAYNGHRDTVEWLLDQYFDAKLAMEGAMAAYHRELIDWIALNYGAWIHYLNRNRTIVPDSYDCNSSQFVLNVYSKFDK